MIRCRVLGPLLIPAVFFGWSVDSNGQNLLANGSFEDINTCTEYSAQCAPSAWFTVSPPEFAWPLAKDGERTLSLIYDNVYKPMVKRSFPYTELLCPLKKGKEYELSFWLFTSIYTFTHIDVRLTPADPTRIPAVIGKTAPTLIYSPHDVAEKDDYGWMLLRRRFVAAEDINFLSLGNMQFPDRWSHSLEKKLEKSYGNIVFWLDDIRLVSTDTAFKMCPWFDYTRSVLYEEHHRHTKQLYLDSFPVSSVPRQLPPGTPASTEPPPPLFVLPRADTIVIPGILFATNSSEINPAYTRMLDSLILRIDAKRPARMQIEGHTDNTASDAVNLPLSRQRAQRIRSYIVRKLSYLDAITGAEGYGSSRPVAANDTPVHKAMNRRVEIILIY